MDNQTNKNIESQLKEFIKSRAENNEETPFDTNEVLKIWEIFTNDYSILSNEMLTSGPDIDTDTDIFNEIKKKIENILRDDKN